MTTENDRIIVKRDIFNGQGDLSMHEQAMREDELVYDASQYKHSWSDDTDSCTFLSDMSKFLLQTPTAFSSDQFDILHLQVINPKFHPCILIFSQHSARFYLLATGTDAHYITVNVCLEHSLNHLHYH